jgi:hypothetical protein
MALQIFFATRTHRSYQGFSKFLSPCTRKTYARTTTSPLGCMNPCTTTSTTPSTAATPPPSAAPLLQLRRASWLPISWLHRLYTSHAMHREYSSPGCTGSTSTVPSASRLLVTRLQRLYINYAARPGASARRTARHAARRAARRRLFRLCRASGCLGTSCGSSSTTSTTLRVQVPRHIARLVTPLVADYFDYVAHPGASARHAARHAARCTAHHRLLRLRRASGCLGTSCGSSRRSSSTTSPTPHVRVPRHVARLITRLVVDYSVRCDFLL